METTTKTTLVHSGQPNHNVTRVGSASAQPFRGVNTSTSTRLNAHVVLGLSLLMLSANAHPLNTPTAGEAETSHGLGLPPANFLSGIRSEVTKGGFDNHLAESILKLLHLNTHDVPEDTDSLIAEGLDAIPTADNDEDSGVSRTSSNESPGSTDANLSAMVEAQPPNLRTESGNSMDSSSSSGTVHLLESLFAQHPGLGFALGVADLMHKMRELFVDIAILEGEERGLRIGGTSRSGSGALLSQMEGASHSLGMGEGGALGLQLTPEGEEIRTVDEKESLAEDTLFDDPPWFEMDSIAEQELSIPGAFDTTPSEDNAAAQQREEALYPNLNPLVNPYAALAISAVVATLFVVGLVVARHYYRSTSTNDSPDLEQGAPPTELNQSTQEATEEKRHGSSSGRSSFSEEFNEKISLEPGVETSEPSAEETTPQSTEQKEAKEALETLIDVANAAYQSSRQSLDEEKPSTSCGTPKSVTNALEVIRMEMEKDPRSFDSVKGSLARKLLLTRSRPATPFGALSRPQTPFSVPSRPQTPVMTFTPADDSPMEKAMPIPVHSSRLAIAHILDSPRSTAASSYVSAASTLANHRSRQALLDISPTGSMVLLNSPTPSMVHLPIERPVTASPGASAAYMSAAASPSTSFIAADSPILASTRAKMERCSFDDPPMSTLGSPQFSPTLPVPGSLVLFGEEESDGRHLGGGHQAAMIPSARMTETALNLALMLPATEWIFQFLVVFVGWFGFMMRPVPGRGTTGGHRRRH
ncbi:hypothetical protein FRC17_003014 [Serendipita sp. 399]|nr:hypothetical protein FRC17_003014 [Serendipita sp. 399]